MSDGSFEKFYRLVLQDLELQAALRDIEDEKRFVERILELGTERGFNFAEQDVENAIKEKRRAWIERWL